MPIVVRSALRSTAVEIISCSLAERTGTVSREVEQAATFLLAKGNENPLLVAEQQCARPAGTFRAVMGRVEGSRTQGGGDLRSQRLGQVHGAARLVVHRLVRAR